ncbi:flippase [Vibrio lentus]|uniref:Polysaccharide biosynthesis protein C-terminal domain-containing protein n=1 Tax=Vibrio lentus TaxID=136468 RepID=A0A2N7C2H6_9VIBR|nr:flippase [Vibrio lentus]PME50263.1 hypothetical protein BCV34_11935 [Vibrio lentus]PME68942.1 hypothetical protein BCV30_22750 [Vibrio lentus]PME90104.1 hypothetical protein BCV27_22490 [Vibrio lentus]
MKNKILKNTFWLFFEKFSSIIGTLFITIYTARYLGPENMGTINFALSIGAIIVPLAQLGSSTLIFDKSAISSEKGSKLIISSQSVRGLIYLIISVFFLLIYHLNENEEFFVFLLIVISFYFLSIDSYKPFFDGVMESRKNMIATQLGLVMSHSLRLLLVFLQKPILFFAIPYILNASIPFFYRKYKFNKVKSNISISHRVKKKYRKFAIMSGIPLALSGLSVIIYVKINQIILGQTLGMESLGLYSSATVIAQGWLFLPMILMTAILSKVISEKNKQMKNLGFSFVYLITITISVCITIFLFFFSESIMMISFGAEFIASSSLIPLLSVSSIFAMIGSVSYRIIINNGGYSFLMKKMAVMAVISVVLSYILIGIYGLNGAVYSVLLVEFFSSTFANYFFKGNMVLEIQRNIFSSMNYRHRLIRN